MQHLPRKKGKGRDSFFCSFLIISILITFSVAMASQDVIYKDTRPLKKVFEDQKKPEKDESEQKAGGFVYDPRGQTWNS